MGGLAKGIQIFSTPSQTARAISKRAPSTTRTSLPSTRFACSGQALTRLTHASRLQNHTLAVEDLAVPLSWRLGWCRLLAVAHQHRDLSAEVLLVEAERLLAVAAVIEIGVQLHRLVSFP